MASAEFRCAKRPASDAEVFIIRSDIAQKVGGGGRVSLSHESLGEGAQMPQVAMVVEGLWAKVRRRNFGGESGSRSGVPSLREGLGVAHRSARVGDEVDCTRTQVQRRRDRRQIVSVSFGAIAQSSSWCFPEPRQPLRLDAQRRACGGGGNEGKAGSMDERPRALGGKYPATASVRPMTGALKMAEAPEIDLI